MEELPLNCQWIRSFFFLQYSIIDSLLLMVDDILTRGGRRGFWSKSNTVVAMEKSSHRWKSVSRDCEATQNCSAIARKWWTRWTNLWPKIRFTKHQPSWGGWGTAYPVCDVTYVCFNSKGLLHYSNDSKIQTLNQDDIFHCRTAPVKSNLWTPSKRFSTLNKKNGNESGLWKVHSCMGKPNLKPETYQFFARM